MPETLFLVVCVAAASLSAVAQDPTRIKRVPAKGSATVEGKDLFREYCAVCHGADLKGNGPAVSALKTSPGDLTTLTRRNAGKYADIRIQRMLTGDGDIVPAHGSREMPIWGSIFRTTSANDQVVAVKVHNLVEYMGSVQAK